MDIFVPIRFRTSIQLSPYHLTSDFETVILNTVKKSLEGVCSRYGYIRPGSIAIVKRSIGTFVKQHFNGHVKFDLVCAAEVCNPTVGAVFTAVVKNKNALGIHAESIINNNETVLDIIIPKRSVGIISTIDLENLQVGDKVFVEVLGKRYQLNDKKISIIGRAIQEPQAAASTSTAAGVEASLENSIHEDEPLDDNNDEYIDEGESSGGSDSASDKSDDDEKDAEVDDDDNQDDDIKGGSESGDAEEEEEFISSGEEDEDFEENDRDFEDEY